MDAVRRREPAAVRALYDQESARVVRLLGVILGPDSELDDLVQQVFLEVLRSLPSFRGDDRRSLRCWVDRVTVHVARHHIRKRRRWRWLRTTDPELLPEIVSTQASPVARAALRRALELLREAPDEERVCFSLRYVEGMELEAIAEATQMSLATVKRRLVRLRRRFGEAADEPLLAAWLDEVRHED